MPWSSEWTSGACDDQSVTLNLRLFGINKPVCKQTLTMTMIHTICGAAAEVRSRPGMGVLAGWSGNPPARTFLSAASSTVVSLVSLFGGDLFVFGRSPSVRSGLPCSGQEAPWSMRMCVLAIGRED